MPRLVLMLTTLIAGFCTPSTSKAQDTLHDMKHGICIPDCIKEWCCDDYCSKPVPCPVPVKCFGYDCYHPKQLPCPAYVKCFRCDDYCRKPLPSVCCPTGYAMKCMPPLHSPANSSTQEIITALSSRFSSRAGDPKSQTASPPAKSLER